MRRSKKLATAKRYAQIERISIAGISERMGPLGLHVYGESFLAAARYLPPPEVPFDPVRPYLVCHSIELCLKAFLSLQGTAMLNLAKGTNAHNLEAILQKADDQGLQRSASLTTTHRAAIRHAAIYYAGKLFEYPAIGEALSAYPKMPPIETLFEAATVLVDSLRQECREVK